MSISLGHRNRLRFNAAGTVTACVTPSQCAAVFAITYKRDATNKPNAHTVLYFGESADVSRDLHTQCHNVREQWLDKGGNEGELFVFYHQMPSSSSWERESVQSQLVAEYDPLMNSEN